MHRSSSIAWHGPSETPGVGGECGLRVKRRNYTLPSQQQKCGDYISDHHMELTCHRMWPAQTGVHGQGLTPNQRAGGSQRLQMQIEIQGMLQPGSHHHWSAQAGLWIVALRRRDRKHVGEGWRSDCKRRQDLISCSSSLGSCSSSSALPQSVWCCLWEDQSWDFFHSGGMFLLWGSGGETMVKKVLEKKMKVWGSLHVPAAAVSQLKEQNPVASEKQLKTTSMRDWAWQTEMVLVC